MLDRDEAAILDFERSWWQRSGAKDQSIEFELGLTAADYYERLLGLLESPAAFECDPLTIGRLRRMLMVPQHREAAG